MTGAVSITQWIPVKLGSCLPEWFKLYTQKVLIFYKCKLCHTQKEFFRASRLIFGITKFAELLVTFLEKYITYMEQK